MLSHNFWLYLSQKLCSYPSHCCILFTFTIVIFQQSQFYTMTQHGMLFMQLQQCVLVPFVIFLTTLLILYPTRLFRKCVSCCRFHRWHALHMFVESFQGQCKDGTNGTRDFRMQLHIAIIISILLHFMHFLLQEYESKCHLMNHIKQVDCTFPLGFYFQKFRKTNTP